MGELLDSMNHSSLKTVPEHVAIIMDGNGRWAKSRGRARIFGHQSGAKRVRQVVESSARVGVKVLTLYAFSEENWSRPKEEVNGLFQLLVSYLTRELAKLHENNVRISVIGNMFKLPDQAQNKLKEAISLTSQNQGLHLVLALSYSSRQDIVEACKLLAEKVKQGSLQLEQIDEHLMSAYLSTAALPDPDLLIRTSGELRVSNFLLWELAYTEFFFVDKYWPEFTEQDYMDALRSFSVRDRRFGGVKAFPGTETENLRLL